MLENRPDLIFDVGLFDGGDTAYYLFRGFNVLAIDANPLMIERAQLRFAKEIQEKRLTLLNVGISDAPGTAEFWVSDHPDWSSFDQRIASRDGTGNRSFPVRVVPFAQLHGEYGVPHYLKIDIEGNDRMCEEGLKGRALPQYVSVESECVGDAGVLSDREATGMLELLRDVGYRKFKLVNQDGWRSVRANGTGRFFMRLMTSAAHGRLRVSRLSAVARKFTDSARISRLGFEFAPGSSGPLGEDVPGSWMRYEKGRFIYLRERKKLLAQAQSLYSFWYDWHATL
jgi:FkbM family methyltransferase